MLAKEMKNEVKILLELWLYELVEDKDGLFLVIYEQMSVKIFDQFGVGLVQVPDSAEIIGEIKNLYSSLIGFKRIDPLEKTL
jgi:hypothetical protein